MCFPGTLSRVPIADAPPAVPGPTAERPGGLRVTHHDAPAEAAAQRRARHGRLCGIALWTVPPLILAPPGSVGASALRGGSSHPRCRYLWLHPDTAPWVGTAHAPDTRRATPSASRPPALVREISHRKAHWNRVGREATVLTASLPPAAVQADEGRPPAGAPAWLSAEMPAATHQPPSPIRSDHAFVHPADPPLSVKNSVRRGGAAMSAELPEQLVQRWPR